MTTPYYAVIFTSRRTEGDHGYAEAAERMVELAREQPGFLGVESARGEDGLGITVSYWASEAAILAWKHHPGTARFVNVGARPGTRRVIRGCAGLSAIISFSRNDLRCPSSLLAKGPAKTPQNISPVQDS
ncbi:antibiotic biosynthesis monooxygenase [Pseudomonas sp. OV226]|nr:antibiotic biosynthesis monooxygenase [Pseudomonas sp. OV226]